MKRRDWLISAVVLCVLAVWAVWGMKHALEKQKPENVRILSERFADLSSLQCTAGDGALITQEEKRLLVQWTEGNAPIEVRTAPMPLQQAEKLLVQATLGGTQNGAKRHRWGYRLWMELQTLRDGQVVDSHRIEAPFTTYRKDRGRVFAAETEAKNCDQYQVIFTVEPVDGRLDAGEFFISYWEVYAR